MFSLKAKYRHNWAENANLYMDNQTLLKSEEKNILPFYWCLKINCTKCTESWGEVVLCLKYDSQVMEFSNTSTAICTVGQIVLDWETTSKAENVHLAKTSHHLLNLLAIVSFTFIFDDIMLALDWDPGLRLPVQSYAQLGFKYEI